MTTDHSDLIARLRGNMCSLPMNAEAATAIERMQTALEWYRDQMCEGFCEEFTPRICKAAMEENPTGGDCAGCRAVLALSQEDSPNA